MADRKTRGGVLKKGSRLLVTVEEALDDVILVCLEHGAKLFRGALLDSNKRDAPFGIKLPNLHADIENKPIKEEKTEIVNMNSESAQKTEISALGYRHTYTLDPSAVDPKLLPPPKRDLSRPLRDKNVRAMRLRPRQVLCSNCKQGIHDNTVVRGRSQNENHAQNTPTLEMHKRKHLSSYQDDSQKTVKQYHHHHLAKISPVIKISYATPRGGGAVVKIPPRSQIPSSPNPDYDFDMPPNPDRTTSMTHAEYHRLRKAMKKAKLKKKLKATESNPVLRVGDRKQVRPGHHKKSKHNKHKTKRKHKHKESAAKSHHYQVTEFAEHGNNPEFLQEDHAVPVGGDVDCDSVGGDSHVEMWAENNTETAKAFDTHQEYSITTTDDFSLKHRIKRNVLRPNDEDSNSGYSMESYRTGTSHNSNNSQQQDFCGEEEEECDSPGFQSEDDDDERDDEAYDECDSGNHVPSGDTATLGDMPSLMMRIHTKTITKCVVDNERTVCAGDIVWGKILGFPWWPGRVISITVSQRDTGDVIGESAHVAWFGSSTTSHMPCSELYPYLDFYKLRHNKKKRGPYKVAVRQATLAAQSMLTEFTDDIEDDEDIEDDLNQIDVLED